MSRALYEEAARQAARRYNIPETGYVQLIAAESAFDPTAVSPAGAQGIAQLMPATATDLGVDPFDPLASLDAGARYLGQIKGWVIGTDAKLAGKPQTLWSSVLASYNWGIGNWRRAYARDPGSWICNAPDETQAYVDRLLGNWTQVDTVTVCSDPINRGPNYLLLLAVVAAAIAARKMR